MTESGIEKSRFIGHDGYINFTLLNKSNTYIWTASADYTIKKWDCLNARCIETLRGHRDRVNYLALNGVEQ